MRPHRFLLMLSVLTLAAPLAARPPGTELTLRYEHSQPLRSRLLFDVALGQTHLEFATWGSGLLLPSRQALRAPGIVAGPAAPSGLFAELLSPIASTGTSAVWAAPTRFSPDFSITPVSRNVLAATVDRAWSRLEAESVTALWHEGEVRGGALALSLETATPEAAATEAAAVRLSLLASESSMTATSVDREARERLEEGWFPGPLPPASIRHALGALELSSAGRAPTTANAGAAVGVSVGSLAVPGLWFRVGALLEREPKRPTLPSLSVPFYVALVSPAYVTGKLRPPSTDARGGLGISVGLGRLSTDISVQTEGNWPEPARGLFPQPSLLRIHEISTEARVGLTRDGVARRLSLEAERIDEFHARARSATVYAFDAAIGLRGPRGALESTLGVGLVRDEDWEASAGAAIGLSLGHQTHSWMPAGVELGGRVRGELAIGEDVALEVTGVLTGKLRVTAPE